MVSFVQAIIEPISPEEEFSKLFSSVESFIVGGGHIQTAEANFLNFNIDF
jgi:hypothetical protein